MLLIIDNWYKIGVKKNENELKRHGNEWKLNGKVNEKRMEKLI